MYNSFLNNINKKQILNKDDKILVAFSGGKDSVVLFDLLLKFNKNIAIAHIDHQIRKDSHKDALFSKRYAKKFKVPYFEKKVDINKGSNIESIAREKRYKALIDIAIKNGYTKIVTAHTKSDNIENFFIRLYRGTSLDGLSGIKEIHNQIIRPLLIFTSKDIRDYIRVNNLFHIEDSSNKENYFLRNKIRNKIIPMMEIENYSLLKNIENLTQQIKLENDFMNQEVLNILNNNFWILDNLIFAKKDTFNSLHLAIKTRIINHILINFLNIVPDKKTIFKINDIFNNLNKKESIRKDIFILSDYNYIVFEKTKNKIFNFKELENIFSIIKNDITYFNNCEIENLINDIDYSISSFSVGNYFTKYNGKNKKLKDIFIDHKIPRFLRKYWPLIKHKNEIIAIPLIEKGSFYKK